ncbi:MAG: NosD domain-containing protein [Arachnia sp.]
MTRHGPIPRAVGQSNRYDVTQWHGDAHEDIGAVINEIVAEVKARQRLADADGAGKPGAVIYIPPGDYRLRTQVLIDISYLRIEGSGHGFASSSIRFNRPEHEWPDLHELWPGGSRILVDLPVVPRDEVTADDAEGAAFLVSRTGAPRISSVEFHGFCIDGLHFVDNGLGGNPENSYINGKTGIYVADANDSIVISGMGMVYLERAVTIYHADALSVRSNFIAECGHCVDLRGWGQACTVSDNHIGAGNRGRSIAAENHGGLLITANNVFPRGASCVHLSGVTRSSVTNNRLHSFYPGMVILDAGSSENLVSANHFLRDHEPWTPFTAVHNGEDDQRGLLVLGGNGNSVTGNHFSEMVDAELVRPPGATPVIIRVSSGSHNLVATNHVIAHDISARSSDSCFEAQVGALLATDAYRVLPVTTVLVEAAASSTVILDSGTDAQVVANRSRNAVRPTPSPQS